MARAALYFAMGSLTFLLRLVLQVQTGAGFEVSRSPFGAEAMEVIELSFRVSGTSVRLDGPTELHDVPFLHTHRLAFIDGEWKKVDRVAPGHVRVLHLTITRGSYRGSRPRPVLDVLTWDRQSSRPRKLYHRVLFDDGDYLIDMRGRVLFLEEDGKMRRVA